MDPHHALPALTVGLSLGYKLMVASAGPLVPIILLAAGAVGSYWFHMNLPRNVAIKAMNPAQAGGGKGAVDIPVGLLRVKGDVSTGRPPFTVFYPADPKCQERGANPPKTAVWLPEGDNRYIKGLGKYAGTPPYLMRALKGHHMEVLPNAKLLERSNDGGDDYDLVIFSHGLAGHQSMYSTFCVELVAQSTRNKKPVVAIALQHCDGSATFSPMEIGNCREGIDFMASLTEPQKVKHHKTQKRHTAAAMKDGGVYYHQPPKGEPEGLQFRIQQLNLRQQELTSVLQYIRSGHLGGTISASPFPLSKTPNVHLVGHSFGAAGVLWATLDPKLRSSFKIESVTALDVWMEPIHRRFEALSRSDKNAKVNGELPPLQLLASEQWEMWEDHKVLEDALVSTWNTITPAFPRCERRMTPKTCHMSLSDIVFMAKPSLKPYVDRSKLDAVIHDWAADTLKFMGKAAAAGKKQ